MVDMTNRARGHTPLPWHYTPTTIGHPDNRINPIIGADNADTGVAYIARVGWQGSTIPGMTSLTPQTFEEAESNACLIVLGANYHARLLEALVNLSQAVTNLQWDVGELPTLKKSYDEAIKLRATIMENMRS